jgi:hypothetical protein
MAAVLGLITQLAQNNSRSTSQARAAIPNSLRSNHSIVEGITSSSIVSFFSWSSL